METKEIILLSILIFYFIGNIVAYKLLTKLNTDTKQKIEDSAEGMFLILISWITVCACFIAKCIKEQEDSE